MSNEVTAEGSASEEGRLETRYSRNERRRIETLLVRAAHLHGRSLEKGHSYDRAELAAILWVVRQVEQARGALPEELEQLRASFEGDASGGRVPLGLLPADVEGQGRRSSVVEELVGDLLEEVERVAATLTAEWDLPTDELASKLLGDAETAELCNTAPSRDARRAALLRCVAWSLLALGAMEGAPWA